MHPPENIHRIIATLGHDENIDFSPLNSRDFKILKIHKRRLSNVYVTRTKTTNSGYVNTHIKIMKCNKKNSKDYNLSKLKIMSEFENHLASYKNSIKYGTYSVVKPIAALPDELAIVTESLHNSITIESMLIKELFWGGDNGMKKLKNMVFLCALLLKEFQKTTHKKMPNIANEIEETKKYITVRIKLINEYLSDTKIDHPTKHLAMSIQETSKLEGTGKLLAKIHGDFTPSNILYDGNKLSLIDFSESKTAPKYADASCFINYLDMLSLNKPIISKNKTNELKQIFLEEYLAEEKNHNQLINLYRTRYLSTNMLTQIYEMKNNNLKKLFLKPRLKRYRKALDQLSSKIE